MNKTCYKCNSADVKGWYTYPKASKSVPLCSNCAMEEGRKLGVRKSPSKKEVKYKKNANDTYRERNNIEAKYGKPLKKTFYDSIKDKLKEYAVDENGWRMFDDGGKPIEKTKRRKWTNLRHYNDQA